MYTTDEEFQLEYLYIEAYDGDFERDHKKKKESDQEEDSERGVIIIDIL